MQDKKPIISVSNLGKSYREGFWRKKTRVLEGVSFSVPAGQIFGFLGANGAGKTTTIKIILGLQSADEGDLNVLGFGPGDVRFKEKLGYLPERPYFQSNLTADEFLDFNRRLFSSGRRGPGNRELLKLVGLPDAGPHALGGFSKGMLQRIGIAQALVNDPELVIFDEPMSGLDPVGRRDVRNLLLELNKSGKTIFFSSHILSDIEALCQQIAFLEKGRLRYSGRVDDLLRTEKQDYEIVVRLPDSWKGEWNGLQAVGDRHRLLTDNLAEARRRVEALWISGAEVVSFGPVHKSLEEALFGHDGGKV